MLRNSVTIFIEVCASHSEILAEEVVSLESKMLLHYATYDIA